MKNMNRRKNIVVIITAAVLLAGLTATRAEDQENTGTGGGGGGGSQTPQAIAVPAVGVNSEAQSADANPPPPAAVNYQNNLTVQSVELNGNEKQAKESAWLGLGVQESSEALSSQLGLKEGEGLTVGFLAPGSPAAKAGFQKNDVLVDFDGQMLVHPSQFRKLVQMHAEGDTVKLVFYRGGKQLTTSVKLGKTSSDRAFNPEDGPLPFDLDLKNLQRQFGGLSGQFRGVGDSLARAGLDKAKIDVDIQQSMEQARKALQDALRQQQSTYAKTLASAKRELETMTGGGSGGSSYVSSDATVTLRNNHNSSRTIVRTDEDGTIIIEAGAKAHLTAQDKDGKLLFDGDIATTAEQKTVPKEVWAKAKPMFEQLH
jgi:hypothetical protein